MRSKWICVVMCSVALMRFCDVVIADIRLECVPETNNVMPFTPLHCVVELRNTGRRSEEATISLPYEVFYAYDINGPWNVYQAYGAVLPSFTPPLRRDVQPGGAYCLGVFIFDLDVVGSGDANVIIDDSHSNLFAKVQMLQYTSIVCRVAVERPKGDNLRAMHFVKQHPKVVGFFSENQKNSGRQTKENIEVCRELVNGYSGTVYNAYAQLALNLRELDENDTVRRDAAVIELKKLGERGPMCIRERALLYAVRGAGAAAMQLKQQMDAEKAKNEVSRWKDAPAATRKVIEQTVDTLMKKFMALDERGSGDMLTDNFVRNGRMNKTLMLEYFRDDIKEAEGKLPTISTAFEQIVTDGSNVTAQLEFTFRVEGRERKTRDRMTFVQKGNKGIWLLATWDSTPVDSPEMKKWEEEVVRMTIEGKTNGFPERPRPK